MLAAAAVSAPGLPWVEALRLPVMLRSSTPASHSTIITGQPGLGHASPAHSHRGILLSSRPRLAGTQHKY